MLGILLLCAQAAEPVQRSEQTRRRLSSWALACCPAVGLAVVAVNPYGQEAIFRALWLGCPGSRTWPGAREAVARRRRRPAQLLLLSLLVAMQAAFLVTNVVLDVKANVIRSSDVAGVPRLPQRRKAEPGPTAPTGW